MIVLTNIYLCILAYVYLSLKHNDISLAIKYGLADSKNKFIINQLRSTFGFYENKN